MNPTDFWRTRARHPALGLLLDLDGTLVPFTPTPGEAVVDSGLIALLTDLVALPGMTVAIVSGRPREWIDAQLGKVEGLFLVAEHGGYRRAKGAWEATLAMDTRPISGLAERLERVAGRQKGAMVERKSWSVTFHLRAVPDDRRSELRVEAGAIVEEWLASYAGFARLDGAEIIEVRPASLSKASAVTWIRREAGPDARLCALGDDLTDEDMFGALGPTDEAIVVTAEPLRRPSAARSRIATTADVRAFLHWIAAARRGVEPAGEILPAPVTPAAVIAGSGEQPRLLVISNRLPDLRTETIPAGPGLRDARKRNVGGLVSALQPVLEARRGLWLGWSGRTVPDGEAAGFGVDDSARPALAWLDFPERWYEHHYNGAANRALWPLFHSFPERVRLAAADWAAYVEVNEAFADAASRLVGSDDPIWIHDYHLLLLGRALRRRGHRGRLGLFLHIPFPSPDILAILPWADDVLDAMTDFDLVAFHTPGYVTNFLRACAERLGARVGDDAMEHRARRTRVRAMPLGIIPESFQEAPPPEVAGEITELRDRLQHRKLVLGVDRLDYSKGIPERLMAFGRLLELHTEWHNRVSFVQLSVPSRADVPAYTEQRARIENLVGRINGEHGEANWVPVQYLYRSYPRSMLVELYRRAHVGLVTPLRDGMNLVAKEYVAAQDAADPGVLVLSMFAGAAIELRDAALTNPWYIDGMAEDLHCALAMPLAERLRRHERLRAVVERTTALDWAEDFLGELTA
jgi:trehalose 6-phosphate synthase